jgi:hypothetical protein
MTGSSLLYSVHLKEGLISSLTNNASVRAFTLSIENISLRCEENNRIILLAAAEKVLFYRGRLLIAIV